MISLLIPVYNFNCSKLVTTLVQQAERCKQKLNNKNEAFDFEIIIADDASTIPDLREANKSICHPNLKYIEQKNNLGRAAIRNFLYKEAQFDYMLFIDCDAEVCTEDFIEQYWIKRNQADVICGSLKTPRICPKGCELRYTYEKKASSMRDEEFRNHHPYSYLSTFNVMFQRHVLNVLQFDERCNEYGYEDALMGLMLKEKGFRVYHFSNPLIHTGLDKNRDFILKTETSLRILRKLGHPMQSFSAISRTENLLLNTHTHTIIHFILSKSRSFLLRNLTSATPSLFCFNLYKLLYYLETKKIQK